MNAYKNMLGIVNKIKEGIYFTKETLPTKLPNDNPFTKNPELLYDITDKNENNRIIGLKSGISSHDQLAQRVAQSQKTNNLIEIANKSIK